MRIAQVVAAYHPHIGGVETHVQRLAQGCVEASDQVTIFTHQIDDSPAEERMSGVRVLRFPLTVKAANYPASIELFRCLKAHASDFDLVHAHSYHTLMGHAAMRTKLPFVYTPHYHGTGHSPFRMLLHRAYRPTGARLFRAADAVICVSNAERALVVDDFPNTAQKIVVIPNGTDPARPGPVGEWESLRDPVVLTVSRLERYKNVDLIIEAFRALPSAATLVVAGDGADRARLEQCAAEPGWPVVLTGRITDAQLRGLFTKATVVASGSDHEAFGMTIATGLASGARVVASDIAAHAEVARLAGPQAPITLVDPRDSPALTEALLAALVAGRVPAGKFLLPSWPEVVENTREVYSRILAQAPSVNISEFNIGPRPNEAAWGESV